MTVSNVTWYLPVFVNSSLQVQTWSQTNDSKHPIHAGTKWKRRTPGRPMLWHQLFLAVLLMHFRMGCWENMTGWNKENSFNIACYNSGTMPVRSSICYVALNPLDLWKQRLTNWASQTTSPVVPGFFVYTNAIQRSKQLQHNSSTQKTKNRSRSPGFIPWFSSMGRCRCWFYASFMHEVYLGNSCIVSECCESELIIAHPPITFSGEPLELKIESKASNLISVHLGNEIYTTNVYIIYI